jgi:peptidoglycan DL-endopeptidase CwlO
VTSTTRRVALALVTVAALASSPAASASLAGPRLAAGPHLAAAPPRLQPSRTDVSSDLAAARSRADKLRAGLDAIQAREEWAHEHLAYVRNQMASATTRASQAEQQLDALASADRDAAAVIGHRVSAIEQSGGVTSLYVAALHDSTSLSDVAANIAALQSVLGHDMVDANTADAAAQQAAALHRRLNDVADQRTRLLKQANQLSDRLARLSQEQRQLLAASTKHVRGLARELAQQREAEREAAVPGVPSNLPVPDATPYAKAAVAAALSKVGDPYVWGAEGPNTFDCSGLVQWSYIQAGLLLPRLASDQYFASTPVSYSDIQPGDLIVYAYNTNDANTIHHITMYIGNGLMVEAPHTGAVVHVTPVYTEGLYGVARPGL